MIRPIYICLSAIMIFFAAVNSGAVQPRESVYPCEAVFTENKGQFKHTSGKAVTARSIHFKSGFRGNDIYIMTDGISSVFAEGQDSTATTFYRLDWRLIGANMGAHISGINKKKETRNYYTADNPNGITGAASYEAVVYKDIYPGIDLKYYFSADGLKYDFIVYPGADPGLIQFSYEGNQALEINDVGELLISAGNITLKENKPFAYSALSDKDGKLLSQDEVFCSFRIERESGNVSFQTSDYDKSQILVIDPQLMWSTYMGGVESDRSYEIETDKSGNVIICGATTSMDFPVSPGAWQQEQRAGADAFVSKFTSSGELLWSTYYGGTNNEYCKALAVDSSGSVIIGGWTWSTDFPLSSGAYQSIMEGELDCFAVKFNSSGQREWATLYGGDDREHTYGAAVNKGGVVVLAGWTASSDFPVSPSAYQSFNGGVNDAYIMLFAPNGSYIWSTYFGGDSVDFAYDVALNRFDEIIITGITDSKDLDCTFDAYQQQPAGYTDSYIARFSIEGDLLYSSYFGGMLNDYSNSVVCDYQGNIYFGGHTTSDDLPATQAQFQRYFAGESDGYLAKFSRFGEFQWLSYLGGYETDMVSALDLNEKGEILCTGFTNSQDFPVTPDAYSSETAGYTDVFISVCSSSGDSLIYSTYFGGSDFEFMEEVSVCKGLNNSIYVSGATASTDFPIKNAFQSEFRGMIDVFVSGFCDDSFKPAVTVTGDMELCFGDSTIISAESGYSEYLWSDGSEGATIVVKKSGNYLLTVTDAAGCEVTVGPYDIHVHPEPSVNIVGDTLVCSGERAMLTVAEEYVSYLWSDGTQGNTAEVSAEGVYYVDITDSNGCTARKYFSVAYMPLPESDIKGAKSVCAESQVEYFVTKKPDYIYSWSVSGGTILPPSDTELISVKWGNSGQGSVRIQITDSRTGCIFRDSISVDISDVLHPEISSESGSMTFCAGDTALLDAGSGYDSYLWNNGSSDRFLEVFANGKYWVIVTDGSGCSGSDTAEVTFAPGPEGVIEGELGICSGAEAVYFTREDSNYSYRWEILRGEISSGDNTHEIYILWDSVAIDTPGKVKLIITDRRSGCTKEDILDVVIYKPRGIRIDADRTEACEGDSIILTAVPWDDNLLWSTGATAKSIIVYDKGSYSIIYTDVYGCVNYDTISIDFYPLPIKPQITKRNDTLESSEAFAYQWLKDDAALTGETDRKLLLTEPGVYKVKVRNEHGCENMSDEYQYLHIRAEARFDIGDTIYSDTEEKFILQIKLTEEVNLTKANAGEYLVYLSYDNRMMYLEDSYDIAAVEKNKTTVIIPGNWQQITGIMHELNFLAVLGDKECGEIEIDSVVWKDANIITITDKTYMCLTDLCQAGGTRLLLDAEAFYMEAVIPNPLSHSATVQYGLMEKGIAKMFVTDIMGREVYGIFDTFMEPGEYELTFSSEDLPSGVYFLVLQTKSQKTVQRIVVVK